MSTASFKVKTPIPVKNNNTLFDKCIIKREPRLSRQALASLGLYSASLTSLTLPF